jgi:hypothetical protein
LPSQRHLHGVTPIASSAVGGPSLHLLDRYLKFAITCPLQADLRWAELRDTMPDQWAEAVAFDRAIRGGHPRQGSPPLDGEAFVHRSLTPLDQVDLDGPADRAVIDGFGNECEGMCAT